MMPPFLTLSLFYQPLSLFGRIASFKITVCVSVWVGFQHRKLNLETRETFDSNILWNS